MEDAVLPKYEINNDNILASDIEPPPQNKCMEIEGVDVMENEAEERKIEGVDSKIEGMES